MGSTVDDLLAGGAGVCQDFVHLGADPAALAGHRRALRVGLPVRVARGRRRDSAEVDTHAWLEALLPGDADGDEPAWTGADPTNTGWRASST